MLFDAGGAQIAAVTDRRLVQVNGWVGDRHSGDSPDETPGLWFSGRLMQRGYITRRYVWFGQIRDVEVDPRRSRLILHTSDGKRQMLRVDGPSLLALASAIRAGLEGPGGSALPPPRDPPGNTGGWAQLFRELLRGAVGRIKRAGAVSRLTAFFRAELRGCSTHETGRGIPP